MPRLICKGSKTKIGLDGKSGKIALNNGVDLGEFPTVDEARAHAETLLPDNRASWYFVLDSDGSLLDCAYDEVEQRRLASRRSRRRIPLTACILALITGGTIVLFGGLPLSLPGWALIAISVGSYLFARLFQNEIGALVVWVIIFLMLMGCALPAIIL